MTRIEPNPAEQAVKIETTVPQADIDKVIANAAILNDPEGKGTVEARGIPAVWRNFKNAVEGAAERIAKIFEQFKLPLQLSGAFTTRSDKVKDLLASEDFIMPVLTDPGAREQFLDKIGATPAEARALQAFAQFYTAFSNKLAENFRQIENTPAGLANQQMAGHGIGAIDANLMPYFTDDNGNLDPNVVAAMALESMQWLTTRGAQSVSNDIDSVRAIFGLSDHAYVTSEMWQAAGQGTLRTAVTSDIGNKAFSHLNLKAKPDAKPLIREKLALSMGAQSIAVLADLKINGEPLVKMHGVSRDHWMAMAGEESALESTAATASNAGYVTLVYNNSTQPVMDPITLKWPRVDINTPLREAIEEGSGIFSKLFASTATVRMPVFEKPEKDSVPTKVSRSLSSIPRKMRARMLTDMQKHYELDTEVLELIERFDPQRFLEMAHGYTNPDDLANKHATERKGLEGKNLGLLRDLQEAQSWKSRYGAKAFYLPLKMIRSGRVYIDSNVINPQASKLHRFMFVREGWRKNITKTKSGDMYEKFMMAVGLGIGIKAENFTRKEVVRQVEAYFKDGSEGRAALDVLAKNEPFTEADYAILERVISKEGTHSLAALNAYMKWDNAAPGEQVSIAMPMETDGITNGYTAGLLQTPPATITPAYKRLLNAGGIFFEGDPWQNWAEYKADGQLDNYQHVAKGTRNFLVDNVQQAVDFIFKNDTKSTTKRQVYLLRATDRVWSSGIVPDLKELDEGNKAGRDWAKNPLMVTSYGASIPSVIRAMVASATEQFYENLAKARNGNAQEIANALNSAYGLANLWVDVNRQAGINRRVFQDGKPAWVEYTRVGTESADGYMTAADVQALADASFGGSLSALATDFMLPKDVKNYMARSLSSTYGTALGQSLSERLKPVLEIRSTMNAGNKLNNLLYERDYARRVASLENDRGNRLSPADRTKIREQMMREGLVPVVATAASEGIPDSLETTNYDPEYYKSGGQLQGGHGLLQEPRKLIDVVYGENNTQTKPDATRSLSARITAPAPNSDIGVKAGVVLTHSLDGVNNSAAWGQNEYAVGNIHDAQLSPWWAADDVAGIANGDFGNMHAGYEMPDQFLRSMLRMTASLLHENDTRLNKKAKDAVLTEMTALQLSPFGPLPISMEDWEYMGINPVQEPVRAGRVVVARLIEQMQEMAIGSREGKGNLFKDIRNISQFAMDGAGVTFPEGITLEKSNAWHMQEVMPVENLMSTMRDYITQNAPIHDRAIAWFKEALRDPDMDAGKAFLSYIDHASTDAESALDLLANAYGDTAFGRQLAALNNVLKPYISDVRTVKTEKATPYADRTHTIHLHAGLNNPIAAFLNQVVQAAAVPRLQEMRANNPTEYKQLRDAAFKTAKAWAKSSDPVVAQKGYEVIRHQQKDSTVLGIAAYLGRVLSTPKSGETAYELLFPTNPKAFANFAGHLQAALRGGQGTSTVLYDEIDGIDDLGGRYNKLLESEKVVKIFKDLAELEQTAEDPAHQAHLTEVVENLVAPGLTSIEPILQTVVRDNEATTNTGETVQGVAHAGDIIRLQAAGNALTNNVDSSLQEKAVNEYVQAIISFGVNKDHFVRKETRRLFEIAKERLNWSDLVPENVTGDPAIAEERAKERYDWIFNNEDPSMGYKAFISIGVSNAQFATALSNIDNPNVSFKAPQWNQGILRAMMSVVRQAIAVVSGTSVRHTGGTLADATRALAQTTIAINQRNQQRIAENAEGPQGNVMTRANQRVVNAVNDRIVEPLGAGLNSINQKRMDPDNPTLPGFLKSATYVALKSRDSEVREEYNKFYRAVAGPNVGKDNSFFEILSEITPWGDDKLSWIDVLRKSKYMVDMARQDATEHTRSYIMDSFDKNNHMTQQHKMAMTKTILKTDLASLMRGELEMDLADLQKLFNNPNAVDAAITQHEAALRARLQNENLSDRFQYFRNQYIGLGQFMRTGKAPIGHQMLNASNITRQLFLPKVSQKAVTDPEVESLIDSLASLYAMKGQSANDLRLTREIINHEMDREDRPGDNGFSRLMGMNINFKELSKDILFKGNPTQMVKGYVYELFDGDVNVVHAQEGSPQMMQAEAEGMVRVGALPKDALDNSPTRYLYKGLRGLNTYNKAAVSLTDIQHRGANLFSTEGYRSQAALQKLTSMRAGQFREVMNQNKPDYVRNGNNVVPVLDDQGNIVDYRYMMSESNKEAVLKKQDPFDRVLPHMFGSLKDRPATVEINRTVVDLLKEEYDGLKDNPEYRFVEISRTSEDADTREMWRLLPEDMQRYAKSVFGSDKILIRDDVVNLVLGYRKMSALNIKDPTGSGSNIWGRGTPIARIADKVWLETVSLMRIKIAILTPLVVVGNIASNTAMLLGEGISPNYIRKNSAEAISAMRQYQKDRKAATELERAIGSAAALGKDTRQMSLRLGRLEADLQANPVGKLVEQGLFTSIASDLGVDDDTIRGSLIQKLEDKASGKVPKAVVKGVKELYMLPGSKGYQAAVAATQYGDFVARYIKVKHDTTVKGVDPDTAIRDALAAFIYYDIPQNKYLQAANDYGPMMFTKFFFRIQSVVARMYSQNPISATSVLMLQRGLLPQPFNENIMNYGLGEGGLSKVTAPWNLPGKVVRTLNPAEPAALDWLTNPLGL
jgi:hypothetical protein